MKRAWVNIDAPDPDVPDHKRLGRPPRVRVDSAPALGAPLGALAADVVLDPKGARQLAADLVSAADKVEQKVGKQ